MSSGESESFSGVRVEIAPTFSLFVDGRPVDVSRPQVRTVLAILATRSRPVTDQELELALWPEAAPLNPSAALRTVVSRCRSALGPAAELLVSDRVGHSLESSSDMAELRALTGERSSEAPISEIEDFLSSSDGVSFAGTVESEYVDELRHEFDRLRARLLRVLVRRYGDAGRHSDTIQFARKIIDRSPEDEGIVCLAARALAVTGRKTEGIELLQRTRSHLMSKGLSASTELVKLESELLQLETGFLPESLVTTRAVNGRFVGRERYLSRFAELGPGDTLLIEGEPGIGKTALLLEHSARSERERIAVVVASGDSTATAVMSGLSSLVRQLIDLDQSSISDEHLPALSTLLPGFDTVARPPTNREALVSGVVDFILTAVHRSRAVIAIDDAQWLDLASGLVLQALIRSGKCRMLMFARPDGVEQLLGDAVHQIESVDLGPLEPSESEALISASSPELTDNMSSERLHEWSGGNPFFLHMLIDLVEQEVDIEGELPPIVLDATQRRMSSLSGSGRRVLQIASVIGARFDEAVVKLLDDAGERGLSEAANAGLITRGIDGHSSFQHAIVADAAYQLLGEADRIALHDQVGRTLQASGSDPIASFMHARKAVTLDGWRAGELALAATRQHLDAFQWESAVEACEWALETGVTSKPHRILIAKSRAELALGVAKSHLTLVEAARAAHQDDDCEWLIEAVIELCNSGSAALTGLDVEVVKELVDAALAVADGSHRIDELRASIARAFIYSRHGAFGQEQYAKAFANYEKLDASVQELVLRNSEAGLSNPKDLGLAQRASTLLSDAAYHSPELRWLARWFQFRDALILGDGDRLAWALHDIRAASTSGERRHTFVALGQTFDMDMQRSWAGATMALIHQDFELAERCAESALKTGLEQLAIRGDGFGEGWVTSSFGLLLLAVRYEQGRLAELVDAVDSSAPLVPAWRVAIVMVHLAAGNVERARDELEDLAADDFSSLVPDPTYTAATYLLAPPVAKYCDLRTIETLYEMILPYRERMSYSGLCTFGPMSGASAVLADALGRTSEGAAHRSHAAQMFDRLRERSRWGYEELLRS